jgi:hypothetical protein
MSVVLGEHTQFTDNEDGTFIVTLENGDEILYTKYIFGNKEELENHINYIDIHIELVKKWLADPASVSQEELKDNRVAAAAADAAYWVKRYEKLKEQE